MGGKRLAPPGLPPGRTRYPSYRRLGGPQSRSGRVQETSPATAFEPRTLTLVASRYTDRAIPALHEVDVTMINKRVNSCYRKAFIVQWE